MEERIKLNWKVENEKEFNEALKYFTNENNQESRLNLYKEYKSENNLENEAQAKLEILKNVFGNYLNIVMNDAQSICEDNIDVANELVGKVKAINEIFKSYDVLSFKEYLCEVVDGINIYEVNSIFEKEYFTSYDIRQISKSINNVLNPNNKKTNENFTYAQKFINHELIHLFSTSRKTSVLYNENKFGKYEKLAKAIIEYEVNNHIEGFDGAISYLIHMDIEYGLDKISSPDELVEILQKIKNDDFNKNDIYNLMTIAVKESKNFEDDGFGGLKNIENSGTTFRAKGVSDRRFGNTLIHSLSGKQFDQGGRAIQLVCNNNEIENTDEDFHELPISVHIGTKPKVSRQLQEFGLKEKINVREQLILSYAENFSHVIAMVANNLTDRIFENGPIEIYTDCFQHSQKFYNDFLSYDNNKDKIINYVQSLINILDKTEILSINNSTYDQDNKHNFILKPLKLIAQSLFELSTNDQEYKQLFSNVFNLIEKNKSTLLKPGNQEYISNLNTFLKLANLSEKIPVNSFHTTLLKSKYDEDLTDILEITDSSKKVEKLYEFFSVNLDSLSFFKFNSTELQGLKNLDSDIKDKLMPFYREIAKSDFNLLRNNGKVGRKPVIDVFHSIIDKLTNKNIKDRVIYADQKGKVGSKIYQLFYRDTSYNDSNYEQIELLKSLEFVSDATIHANHYTLSTNTKNKLRNKLGEAIY